MKFFLDNCLSPYMARGLSEFATLQRHEIVHLTTAGRFKADTPDAEWLRTLGEEGEWIVLSGDDRITRSPAERRAWHESGLTAFFFAPPFASMGYWKQAAVLVEWFPRIAAEARSAPTGVGYSIVAKAKDMKLIYAPAAASKRK